LLSRGFGIQIEQIIQSDDDVIVLNLIIHNRPPLSCGHPARLFCKGFYLFNSVTVADCCGELRREGDRAIVDWQDSAPGVGADELPRLTERLYRVESSRSRAGGGSGLGLAIARAIVEGHGGTLRVAPSPLGGLAVRLVFPRHA